MLFRSRGNESAHGVNDNGFNWERNMNLCFSAYLFYIYTLKSFRGLSTQETGLKAVRFSLLPRVRCSSGTISGHSPVFDDLIAMNLKRSHDDLGCVKSVTEVEFLGRHKDVEPARNDEAETDNAHNANGRCEGKDVQGVVTFGVEEREGERCDNGKDRRGDIAEDETPENGNVPSLASCDDNVEVPAKLVELNIVSIRI